MCSTLLAAYPNTPVIMSTGYADPSQEGALQELGIVTILQKPFRGSQLVQAVHEQITVSPIFVIASLVSLRMSFSARSI